MIFRWKINDLCISYLNSPILWNKYTILGIKLEVEQWNYFPNIFNQMQSARSLVLLSTKQIKVGTQWGRFEGGWGVESSTHLLTSSYKIFYNLILIYVTRQLKKIRKNCENRQKNEKIG